MNLSTLRGDLSFWDRLAPSRSIPSTAVSTVEDIEEAMGPSEVLNRQISVSRENDTLLHRDSTDTAILVWERR